MNQSSDLIVNVKPKSAFSEAIKTIRTNLQFSGFVCGYGNKNYFDDKC